MKRAAVLGVAFAAALRAPAGAQPARVYRVGILWDPTVATERTGEDAFLRALSGFGYQPGKNLEIMLRGTGGVAARLPQLAAELVRAKPDAIVTAGGQQIIAALKHATTSVPIVMVRAPNPVGYGFVASLARPGGNITGVTNMDLELSGKRLQLLRELNPQLRRVAVIRNPTNPGNMAFWHVHASEAGKLGITAVPLDLRSPEQVAGVATAIARERVGGVDVLADLMLDRNAAKIVRAIASLRLPAIYQDSSYTAVGGLLFYGASVTAMWVQAATYVARILTGAKPADLPVEQPETFDLVVNLKTAREIGLTVPQSILLQATQVIR